MINIVKDKTTAFEEIGEKRTPLGGIFLLAIMSVLLIIAGEFAFSDIDDIPTRPEPLSYYSYYANSNSVSDEEIRNEEIGSFSQSVTNEKFVTYSQIEKDLEIDTLIEDFRDSAKEISDQIKVIYEINNEISNLSTAITRYEYDYNLSLQEKSANVAPIYNTKSNQTDILRNRSAITTKQAQLVTENAKLATLESKAKPAVEEIFSKYITAHEKYDKEITIYELYKFLLKLLFIAPIFLFAVRYYFKLKRKNSPYSIIFAVIMGITGLLFAQISITFIYYIIPKGLLAKIMAIFAKISALRYILYYGSFFILIGVFGGLVYLIQKKIFNPTRILIRRLKDNKCPACEFKINDSQIYCTRCGLQIMEKCAICASNRNMHLPFCPVCGHNKIPPNKA